MSEVKGKAKASVKSGVDFKEFGSTTLGGIPPRKDVEAIDKVNTPKDAPRSVRA